jgi:hypothetical protein
MDTNTSFTSLPDTLSLGDLETSRTYEDNSEIDENSSEIDEYNHEDRRSRIMPHFYEEYFGDNDENDENEPMDGVAYQVHNVFNNIKENLTDIYKKLGKPELSFKKYDDLFDLPPDLFMLYLQHKFFGKIIDNYDDNNKIEEYKQKIEQILLKFWSAGDLLITSESMNNMFNWTQFVLRQPKQFQTAYFECYLQDTYNAYDGDSDNISCPKGIYERLLFAIGDACIIYCTQYEKKKENQTRKKKMTINYDSLYKNCEKSKYIHLIRLFKKEIPDINELTKQWSSILESDEGKKMDPDALKKNFIEFMNKTYKRYGLNKEDEIEKRANDLEAASIFKDKQFGGKKRKNKTKNKTRKLKKKL